MPSPILIPVARSATPPCPQSITHQLLYTRVPFIVLCIHSEWDIRPKTLRHLPSVVKPVANAYSNCWAIYVRTPPVQHPSIVIYP
ncbi:hypothetical protein T07_10059 [Trichinella nelsoni]|uniref:Uncharacterized protein n=1 Tax=Trichinella nelsoni TaxID=6336 RepID=A0A0V0RCS8_9BILA|nr:hypothetical protein T07_10059 [Trichinella nelsoni]